MDSLAVLVAACPRAYVDGIWQRHVATRHAAQALDGRHGTGRWSTKSGFRVLYLGRPTNSVIIEAYRHLVDPIEDARMLAQLEPRTLVTCTVEYTDLLDLRESASRMQLDLPFGVLHSATSDSAAYAPVPSSRAGSASDRAQRHHRPRRYRHGRHARRVHRPAGLPAPNTLSSRHGVGSTAHRPPTRAAAASSRCRQRPVAAFTSAFRRHP